MFSKEPMKYSLAHLFLFIGKTNILISDYVGELSY